MPRPNVTFEVGPAARSNSWSGWPRWWPRCRPFWVTNHGSGPAGCGDGARWHHHRAGCGRTRMRCGGDDLGCSHRPSVDELSRAGVGKVPVRCAWRSPTVEHHPVCDGVITTIDRPRRGRPVSRGTPPSFRWPRGRCAAYLPESPGRGSRLRDRTESKLQRDRELLVNNLRVPRNRDLDAGSQSPCGQRQEQRLQKHPDAVRLSTVTQFPRCSRHVIPQVRLCCGEGSWAGGRCQVVAPGRFRGRLSLFYPAPAPPSVNAVRPTRRVRVVDTVTAGSPGLPRALECKHQ
jgi:hypothetical protein